MSYTPATEELIRSLQCLPGVGTRTAQRMALFLLERDSDAARSLKKALTDALDKVHKCPSCRALTELELCDVCASSERASDTLCVVANDADRSSIEMSGKYQGKYFVLHGVLSPMDGIGPEQLGVFDLLEKVKQGDVREVILALDEQMESEATAHYISELLKDTGIVRSRVRFSQMKSGALDKVESHKIANAIAGKQEIGFEHD